MKSFTIKNAKFLGTQHVHAYQINQEEAHKFIMECDKPLADAVDKLVRALQREGEVGYLVLQLKND